MTAHRILLLPVFAALLAAGCGSHDVKKPTDANAAEAPPADTVLLASTDVATAARLDLAAGVPVSGTLTAGWEAHITSPFDDVVEEVLVREGQRVAKGEVLARFR